jgi:hypothetical protein
MSEYPSPTSAWPLPPDSINSFAGERGLEAESVDTLAEYSQALGNYRREVAGHLGATLHELHEAAPEQITYSVSMAFWARRWERDEERHEQIEIQAGLIPTPRPPVIHGSFLPDRPVK